MWNICCLRWSAPPFTFINATSQELELLVTLCWGSSSYPIHLSWHCHINLCKPSLSSCFNLCQILALALFALRPEAKHIAHKGGLMLLLFIEHLWQGHSLCQVLYAHHHLKMHFISSEDWESEGAYLSSLTECVAVRIVAQDQLIQMLGLICVVVIVVVCFLSVNPAFYFCGDTILSYLWVT